MLDARSDGKNIGITTKKPPKAIASASALVAFFNETMIYGAKRRKSYGRIESRLNKLFSIIWRDCLYRTVAAITLVAFVTTSVTADFAWAARTPSVLTSVGTDPRAVSPVSPGSFKELNVRTFSLPQSLGTIKDSWQPPVIARSAEGATKQSQSRTTVIHIQDAHCNYYAQHSISDIIEYLSKEYGISQINLEGGAKDYDLSIFTRIKDKAVRERVADYFVKEGIVNGAEYFALNNPDKVSLWGIEDTRLYIDNLKVYRDSLKTKDDTDKLLKNLSYIFANLKMKIYSKGLLELDLKYNQYKANNIEFKDYLSYLVANSKDKLIDIKSFPNIFLLNQVLKQESEIDFNKANDERDQLIDKLQKRLSKNGMKELVGKIVEFKAGTISQEEFYRYLVNKAKEADVSIENFPQLERYIVYISSYAAVDKSKIIDEVAALENKIRDCLFRNDKERELDRLSRDLAILKNIFNISLTRADYQYYKANEGAFDMKNYVSFIEREAPLCNITARLDDGIARLDGYRTQIEKFYEYSFKRDEAFIKNVRLGGQGSRVPAQGAAGGAGKGQGTKTAIIVTGGFHTENLCEQFKQNKIAYISIMPNFKNCEGYECPYFGILSGNHNILDKRITTVLGSSLATASIWTLLGREAGEDVEQWRLKIAIRVLLEERGIAGQFVLNAADGTRLVVNAADLTVVESLSEREITEQRLETVTSGDVLAKLATQPGLPSSVGRAAAPGPAKPTAAPVTLPSASVAKPAQEPAAKISDMKTSLEEYLDDIKRAEAAGKINVIPSGDYDHFSHLDVITPKGKKYAGNLSYNTRSLSGRAKRIYEFLLTNHPESTLRVLEVGAGAGFACSEMSLYAEKMGAKVELHTIGLTPIAPRFRLRATVREIGKMIHQYVIRTHDLNLIGLNEYMRGILTKKYNSRDIDTLSFDEKLQLFREEGDYDIPFKLIFDFQEKSGYQIFEVLPEPFIEHQDIGKFLDRRIAHIGTYDFIHDDFGGIFYSLFTPQKTINKVLPRLSNEGILYLTTYPEGPATKLKIPKNKGSGYIVVSAGAYGEMLIVREGSSHHRKLREVLKNADRSKNGIYFVSDFEKVVQSITQPVPSAPAAPALRSPTGVGELKGGVGAKPAGQEPVTAGLSFMPRHLHEFGPTGLWIRILSLFIPMMIRFVVQPGRREEPATPVLQKGDLVISKSGTTREIISIQGRYAKIRTIKKGKAPVEETISLETLLKAIKVIGAEIRPKAKVTEMTNEEVVRHNEEMLNSHDFWDTIGEESIGGNAGVDRAAVHIVIDSSGRIVAIGNIDTLNPEYLENNYCHVYFSVLMVNTPNSGVIDLKETVWRGHASKTAENNLREAVSRYNKALVVRQSEGKKQSAAKPALEAPVLNINDLLHGSNDIVAFIIRFLDRIITYGIKWLIYTAKKSRLGTPAPSAATAPAAEKLVPCSDLNIPDSLKEALHKTESIDSRLPAFLMRDLVMVGPKKPTGNFPMTYLTPGVVNEISNWAHARGLEVRIFYPFPGFRLLSKIFPRLTRLASIWVYDKNALNAFFNMLWDERGKTVRQILADGRIPTDPDRFIRYLENHHVDNQPANTIIALAFSDRSVQDHPMQEQFKAYERSVKDKQSAFYEQEADKRLDLINQEVTANEDARNQAIRDLSECVVSANSRKVINALTNKLRSKESDEWMRLAIVSALGSISDQGFAVDTKIFIDSMDDESFSVRDEAAFALNKIDKDALDEFRNKVEEAGLIGKSVIRIETERGVGGSAFAVAEDDTYVYLFTNTHVVGTRKSVKVAIGDKLIDSPVVTRFSRTGPGGFNDIAIIAFNKAEARLIPLKTASDVDAASLVGEHATIVSGFHSVIRPPGIIVESSSDILYSGGLGKSDSGDSGGPIIVEHNGEFIASAVNVGKLETRCVPLTNQMWKRLYESISNARNVETISENEDSFVWTDEGLFNRAKAALASLSYNAAAKPAEAEPLKAPGGVIYGYFYTSTGEVVIDRDKTKAMLKNAMPNFAGSPDDSKLTGFVHAHELFHQLIQKSGMTLPEEREERLASIFAMKALGLSPPAREETEFNDFASTVQDEAIKRQLTLSYESPEFLLNLHRLGINILNVKVDNITALPQGAKAMAITNDKIDAADRKARNNIVAEEIAIMRKTVTRFIAGRKYVLVLNRPNHFNNTSAIYKFARSLPFNVSIRGIYTDLFNEEEWLSLALYEMLKNAHDAIVSLDVGSNLDKMPRQLADAVRKKSKGDPWYFHRHGIIKVAFVIKDNELEISVQDNGAGIYAATTEEKNNALRDYYYTGEQYYWGSRGMGSGIIEEAYSKKAYRLELAGSPHRPFNKGTVVTLRVPLSALYLNKESTSRAKPAEQQPMGGGMSWGQLVDEALATNDMAKLAADVRATVPDQLIELAEFLARQHPQRYEELKKVLTPEEAQRVEAALAAAPSTAVKIGRNKTPLSHRVRHEFLSALDRIWSGRYSQLSKLVMRFKDTPGLFETIRRMAQNPNYTRAYVNEAAGEIFTAARLVDLAGTTPDGKPLGEILYFSAAIPKSDKIYETKEVDLLFLVREGNRLDLEPGLYFIEAKESGLLNGDLLAEGVERHQIQGQFECANWLRQRGIDVKGIIVAVDGLTRPAGEQLTKSVLWTDVYRISPNYSVEDKAGRTEASEPPQDLEKTIVENRGNGISAYLQELKDMRGQDGQKVYPELTYHPKRDQRRFIKLQGDVKAKGSPNAEREASNWTREVFSKYGVTTDPKILTAYFSTGISVARQRTILHTKTSEITKTGKSKEDIYKELWDWIVSVTPPVETAAPSTEQPVAEIVIDENATLAKVDTIVLELQKQFEEHYPPGKADAAIRQFCVEILHNAERASKGEGAAATPVKVSLYYYIGEKSRLEVVISNKGEADKKAIEQKLAVSAGTATDKLVKAGGTGEELNGGIGISIANSMAEALGGNVRPDVGNGWTHVIMSIPTNTVPVSAPAAPANPLLATTETVITPTEPITQVTATPSVTSIVPEQKIEPAHSVLSIELLKALISSYLDRKTQEGKNVVNNSTNTVKIEEIEENAAKKSDTYELMKKPKWLAGGRVFDVGINNLVLVRRDALGEGVMVTQNLQSCTGICIRARDAAGNVYYGLAHIFKEKEGNDFRNDIEVIEKKMEKMEIMGLTIEEKVANYEKSFYNENKPEGLGLMARLGPGDLVINARGITFLPHEGLSYGANTETLPWIRGTTEETVTSPAGTTVETVMPPAAPITQATSAQPAEEITAWNSRYETALEWTHTQPMPEPKTLRELKKSEQEQKIAREIASAIIAFSGMTEVKEEALVNELKQFVSGLNNSPALINNPSGLASLTEEHMGEAITQYLSENEKGFEEEFKAIKNIVLILLKNWKASPLVTQQLVGDEVLQLAAELAVYGINPADLAKLTTLEQINNFVHERGLTKTVRDLLNRLFAVRHEYVTTVTVFDEGDNKPHSVYVITRGREDILNVGDMGKFTSAFTILGPTSSAVVEISRAKVAAQKGASFLEREEIAARQSAVVKAYDNADGRGAVVKTIVGVPADLNETDVQKIVLAVSRKLAANGFGEDDIHQIMKYRIYENDMNATMASLEHAIDQARSESKDARIVAFVFNGEKPEIPERILKKAEDDGKLALVLDAYSDRFAKQRAGEGIGERRFVCPSLTLRGALARQIDWYYQMKSDTDRKRVLDAINDLRRQASSKNDTDITQIEQLRNLPLIVDTLCEDMEQLRTMEEAAASAV